MRRTFDPRRPFAIPLASEARELRDADLFFEELTGWSSGPDRHEALDVEGEAEAFFEDLVGEASPREGYGERTRPSSSSRSGSEAPWIYDGQTFANRPQAEARARVLQQSHTSIEIIERRQDSKWQVRHRHPVPTSGLPSDDPPTYRSRSEASRRAELLQAYGFSTRVRRRDGRWQVQLERRERTAPLPSAVGLDPSVQARGRLQASRRAKALEAAGFGAKAERAGMRDWKVKVTRLPTFGTAASSAVVDVPAGSGAAGSTGGTPGGATTNQPGTPTPTAPACALALTSQTQLTQPANRDRTRISVTEVVTLRANGGTGEITWSIANGEGALSGTTGASVTFTARELAGNVTVRARDAAGCEQTITFDVVFNYLITPAQIRAIFPDATAERVDDITRAFNEFYERFALTTCLRRAHFFAQVRTEVGAEGVPRRENLNYAATALAGPFRYYRLHPDDADRHGRTADHAADQQAIANHAYANRNGNGDIASGDGWNYRGRGFIQVTGRGNYRAVQQEINRVVPDSGVDIEANPDDAIAIRAGMLSAMAFWSMNDINDRADGGSTDADVDRVTARVNPGSDGAERRRNFRTVTSPLFHLAECAAP